MIDHMEELRNIEFQQLSNGVFADFGGSFPVPQTAIDRMIEYTTDIASHYPDATGSSPVSREIDTFKNELLELLGTNSDEYSVIFGVNASAVLRYLAFAFPFGKDSKFIYHIDNHNSVLGMRKIASSRALGGGIVARKTCPDGPLADHSLFAYAPQSNFNGKKYPLSWVNDFQSQGEFAHALIDCAAYAPSNTLNLREYPADFVVVSLLKMFGCPGGALLVRNSAQKLLQSTTEPSYDEMSILGCRAGLSVRRKFETILGGDISQHVYNLAKDLHARLTGIHHANGKPLAVTYPQEFGPIEEQGGTLAFNVFDPDGRPIDHNSVFTAAVAANNLFVRFGVHCNPGGTYTALGWTPQDIKAATKDHEAACSLTASIMRGKHVGSIRVSFGFISTQADVDAIVSFFEANFIVHNSDVPAAPDSFKLSKVFIHPIRGCQGVQIVAEKYGLDKTGLRFDGRWGVTDELSTFLDRRKCPRLAELKIETNPEMTDMTVSTPEGESITISLTAMPGKSAKWASSTACHEKMNGKIYGPEVNDWFSKALGQKAILVKLDDPLKPPFTKPFRCFFTASLAAVGCNDVELFNPHFIFESETPFCEDAWVGSKRKIGDLPFTVSRKLPITTEAVIDCHGGENSAPLHAICALHKVQYYPAFGLELIADFPPSTRRDPKELVLDSVFC